MDSPSTPRTFASPNPGDLLRRRILSWSKEKGTSAAVHVHVDGKIFHLHEAPLVSKSGFFKKALSASSDIELGESFPGGSHAFEMTMLFIYGAPLPLDPFNVLALRCAAGFLEMTEECSTGNLCEQSDLYLNQVVFQSWDETLIVLKKCRTLLSWSEELLVTSRCIESLAFMACMEILDPERERELPLLNLHAMAGRPWSYEAVKEVSGQDLWIKELIALPFDFFERIINSLRKQGMKEKYVSPLIVFYANKWVLSKKTHSYRENNDEKNAIFCHKQVSEILLGLIGLLPSGRKNSKVIPVGFYLAMISSSINLGLNDESFRSLEDQASSLLQFARVEDFLLPASGERLNSMERIFALRLSSKSCGGYSLMNAESRVAELWDRYLSAIVVDSKLGEERFIKLIEAVPMADRETHDHLYRAISAFLREHPELPSEGKEAVCQYLNCNRLSQPSCIQAVQDEAMPLGIIVKALSVQQLHTHKALKDFSESFRYSEFSESLPSSRSQALLNRYLGESPFQTMTEEEDNGVEMDEYGSASFRIRLLEKELMALKLSLKQQSLGTKSSRIDLGSRSCRHGRSWVGAISWRSRRKYVKSLLNVFRRMRKQVAGGVGGSSVDCKRKTSD